jgi:hypothetical protein
MLLCHCPTRIPRTGQLDKYAFSTRPSIPKLQGFSSVIERRRLLVLPLSHTTPVHVVEARTCGLRLGDSDNGCFNFVCLFLL